MLAPPAIVHLRAQAGGQMERSLSADIREEREDLREAAEQTLNVIMDLGLKGNIRWVSPSWTDVIGTSLESVKGKAIKDLLMCENKEVFTEVVDSMQKDDSRSQIVRFSVELGPASKLAPIEIPDQLEDGEDAAPNRPATIELEGQGIMVYDRSSGGESHVRRAAHTWITSMLTVVDNVDDQTLACTARDPNRPTCCNRRFPGIWRRDPGKLSHNFGRSWFGGPSQPRTTSTCSVPYLRTSDFSLVVREAYRTLPARAQG